MVRFASGVVIRVHTKGSCRCYHDGHDDDGGGGGKEGDKSNRSNNNRKLAGFLAMPSSAPHSRNTRKKEPDSGNEAVVLTVPWMFEELKRVVKELESTGELRRGNGGEDEGGEIEFITLGGGGGDAKEVSLLRRRRNPHHPNKHNNNDKDMSIHQNEESPMVAVISCGSCSRCSGGGGGDGDSVDVDRDMLARDDTIVVELCSSYKAKRLEDSCSFSTRCCCPLPRQSFCNVDKSGSGGDDNDSTEDLFAVEHDDDGDEFFPPQAYVPVMIRPHRMVRTFSSNSSLVEGSVSGKAEEEEEEEQQQQQPETIATRATTTTNESPPLGMIFQLDGLLRDLLYKVGLLSKYGA